MSDSCRHRLRQIMLHFGLSAFLGWTVTSFLCHQSTQVFLKTSNTFFNNGLLWAVVITVCQMTMCFLLTDIHRGKSPSGCSKKHFWIKITCHVLATMATNYSMTLIDASSTFAIKLLEPATSGVVQRVVLGTSLAPSAMFSLPFIIGGAMIFCGISFSWLISGVGFGMALLSTIILAFRNVAIKLEQADTSVRFIKLRETIAIILVLGSCVVLVAVAEFLTIQKVLPPSVSFLLIAVLCSSVFHVIYSYISTNVVLLFMSVVSHSVVNIVKRVLVVLLLYLVGHRDVNLSNFGGLAVCALGLLVYVLSNNAVEQTGPRTMVSSGALWVAMILSSTFIAVQMIHRPVETRDITTSFYNRQLKRNTKEMFVGKSFDETPFSMYIRDTDLTPNVPDNMVQFRHEFLKLRLYNNSLKTNILSPHLTTSVDIIKESQRIQFNIFSDLLATYRYAILFDVAVYENKGDPAISAGEMYLLRRLGITVLHYCLTGLCQDIDFQYAKKLASLHSKNKVVILMSGGGNLVGYAYNDYLRKTILKRFPEYHKVLFPQSILLRKGQEKHLQFCQSVYGKKSDFTMILRDRLSLRYALDNFKGPSQFILMPDMSFQIGAIQRFMSPVFDILWLKREDEEAPGYVVPDAPLEVTMHCADWRAWPTPKGSTSMETAFLMANNGLIFLQRGRVVITDRLHGHILCTLLDIPHVLIDNSYQKLSSYHNTWTRGLANAVITDNATHALELAVQLLKKYGDILPPIGPFVEEEFIHGNKQ